MSDKLSYEEFTKKAIVNMRKGNYKGIHAVYSGFNQAFRSYYNEDPIKIINQLAEEGKIVSRLVKGGAMLYLPEDAPITASSGEEALKKILG